MEIKIWLSAERRPAVICSNPKGKFSRAFVFSDREPFNWTEVDVKAIFSDARMMDESQWEETFPSAAANTSLIEDQYGDVPSAFEKHSEQAAPEDENDAYVCPICGSLEGCSKHAVMLFSRGEIDDGSMYDAEYDFREALSNAVKSLYERNGAKAIDQASRHTFGRYGASWEMVWERYREWIGPEGSSQEKEEDGEFDPNFGEFTTLLAEYLWPYCRSQELRFINSLGFSYYCDGLYAEDPGQAIAAAMRDFQSDLDVLTKAV